jgi:very-short-patch-repair endonuclease
VRGEKVKQFKRWNNMTDNEQALTLNPSPPGEGLEKPTPSSFHPSPEGEGPGVRAESRYHELASKMMIQIVRDLRQRETPAEDILWECLRDRRLAGLKFRRQHAIANTTYVADFFCYEARLVIELDGLIHDLQVDEDIKRQQEIEALEYRVIRFKNNQISTNLEGTLMDILRAVHADPKK